MEMRTWIVKEFGPHRDVLELNKWPMLNPGERKAQKTSCRGAI